MQANLYIWCQPKENWSVATLEEKLAILDLRILKDGMLFFTLGSPKYNFDSAWFLSHMLIFVSISELDSICISSHIATYFL